MADTGDLLTASEITSLKKLTDEEVVRRSNSKSIGSLSAYTGSNYQYGIVPAADETVLREHIQKITEPINAIDGKTVTPEQASLALAATFKDALVKVNKYSSISVTAASTGCKSSCTGLCSSSCYSNCTGCAGRCSGSCGGSCSNDCRGDCERNCADDCYSFCEDACSTHCRGGCSGNCNDGCKAKCADDCSAIIK